MSQPLSSTLSENITFTRELRLFQLFDSFNGYYPWNHWSTRKALFFLRNHFIKPLFFLVKWALFLKSIFFDLFSVFWDFILEGFLHTYFSSFWLRDWNLFWWFWFRSHSLSLTQNSEREQIGSDPITLFLLTFSLFDSWFRSQDSFFF